jgi:hypothetical protein
MQRARRLTSLAALALVGSLALTGCRSQPGAAIYIGSATYSEQYVNGLADQLQKVSTLNRGDGRQTITERLMVRDLGKRLVADKKWPAPEVQEESAATLIRNALQSGGQGGAQPSIEPFRPLIQVLAQYQAYRGVVQQHATLEPASDADHAELYERAKTAGQVPSGVDAAAYRQMLGPDNERTLQATLGLRKLYAEALKGTDVSLNPKYGARELVLLRDDKNNPMVVVPLDAKGAKTAVVRAPALPQPQSQDPGNG